MKFAVIIAARFAADHMAICVNSVSAVSASVSWLTRARSPACVRLLSKKIENGAAKRLDELKFVWYAEKWGISEEMHPLCHVQKCFWSLALIFFNKGL